MIRLLLLLATVLLLGCGSDSAPEKVCVSGQTQSCLCPGAVESAQVCNAAGNGWDPCQCNVATKDTYVAPVEDLVAETVPDVEGPCGPDEIKMCVENSVWCYNEFTGEKGLQIEICNPPETQCAAGACVAVPCLENDYKGCVDNNVHWFNSCDEEGDFIKNCGDAGQCVDGECTTNCVPHDHKDCHEGQVHWFDSCGALESVAEICTAEQFCHEGSCVKPFYNGAWLVTANPNSKPACGGLGNATFAPATYTLTVDGSAATISANFFGTQVTLTGTVTGKQMILNGSYSVMGENHTEDWDVTFTSPTQFDGFLIDSVDIMGFPCAINWDITGDKQ